MSSFQNDPKYAKAAELKAGCGKVLSIRRAMLAACFSKEDANNTTYQQRVRRLVALYLKPMDFVVVDTQTDVSSLTQMPIVLDEHYAETDVSSLTHTSSTTTSSTTASFHFTRKSTEKTATKAAVRKSKRIALLKNKKAIAVWEKLKAQRTRNVL